jgi:hypothetical protein
MMRRRPSRPTIGACAAQEGTVTGAAYTAFHDGLHAALYLSAGLMLGTGLLALLALRSRPLTGEEHDQDSPNG